MHRIDHASSTPDGKFTEGNPITGTPPTKVTADIMNAMMLEIVNAVEGAGITLDKENNSQLLAAIQALAGLDMILQPTHLYPAANSVNIEQYPTLSASQFGHLYDLPHAAAQFQIATSQAFTNIIYDQAVDGKTVHNVASALTAGTVYFWRVRFQDSRGNWSSWSTPTQFTTKSSYLLSGTWAALASALSPRNKHCAVVYGHEMFVFGGENGDNLTDFVKYDFLTNTWTSIPWPGPSARYYFSMNVWDGKIYLYGGYDGSTTFNDLWVYDIKNGGWTTRASGPAARYGHASECVNGKIYVYGGMVSSAACNELHCYDIATNTWSTLTAGGNNIAYHSLVHDNGYLYQFAGKLSTTFKKELWRYQISNNTWTQITFSGGPAIRAYHAAVVIAGHMYVFGGDGSITYNDLWQYNISTNTWTQLTSGGDAVYSVSGVVFNNKMFVFGGRYTTTRYKTLYAIS